ncbi:MAG: Formyltetrahydrofolate deformylase [Lentisphaerae bacterium ADurb.Bin242]|nr:MAG: Formyltetrahydrofolate deformylase [Lentisphaerae bacterium ADurb.Bin242]
MKKAVFLIYSNDRKGLLSGISTFFYQKGFNILHCQQYTDNCENRYFMRVCLDITDMPVTRKNLEDSFAVFASTLNLQFSVHYSDRPQRVAILVSRASHCLYDLLAHAQDEKDLLCEIPLIISNHPVLEDVAAKFRVPFYCFPVGKDKPAQEQPVIELLHRHHIDLVVLARYMQILSGEFIREFPSRIINIHHAFLPAFQGRNPYERAWERGVKMIGATAHYATAVLDEGPIIEQDVERITHEAEPADLKQIGKDIERRVLTRAVRAHLEHRIILSGRRTIVFSK